MTDSVQTKQQKAGSAKTKARFTPKMDNFRTSLMYEGLTLKKNPENQSIADLKRKYAR
ncbi:hypothetical protein [Lacimicrobium alkaliphilum]|uniref:hypothetical protein n=1 Tax=Lacimicrobium alkaliphilum TaxID=1526571 RepID=UPI0018D21203|nr:hypothetical protein [Lacimicrobium alkaliphilum]